MSKELRSEPSLSSVDLRRVADARHSDRVLEGLARAFGPMHHKIFKPYWDNSMVHAVGRVYIHSDYEHGVLEFYIPTEKHPDQPMSWLRVVVKTLPGLDPEIMDREAKQLRSKRFVCNGRGPPGRIDSESVFLVAPRLSPEGLKNWQEDRGREARGEQPKKEWVCRAKFPYPGVGIMPIFDRLPESCVKTILVLLAKFIERRLKDLERSLHISIDLSKLRGWRSKERYHYYIGLLIGERVSWSLGNFVRCFSKILIWFRTKIKEIFKGIGRQNLIKKAIYKLRGIQPLLRQITSIKTPFENSPNDEILAKLISNLGPGPPITAHPQS